MAAFKEMFLCAVCIGLLVNAYLLLKIVPLIKSNKVGLLLRSTMSTNISHLEVHSNGSALSGNIPGRILMPHDLAVKEPKSLKSVSPIPHSGQCYYKIQVYDDQRRKVIKRQKLHSIVQQSKGPDIKANVSCTSDCIIEVTIANASNKFAGMDAVVFHFEKGLIPKSLPPASINSNQALVYYSGETPYHTSVERDVQKFSAHATWTYYSGSDITFPLGFYAPGTPMINHTKSVADWLKGKTKLILWMASNCKFTSWPRTRFVMELKKFIEVDIYGKCGKHDRHCLPRGSAKCDVDLLRKYKFYLSLENSECEEYITEKVWNMPLRQGVVPIVYGATRKSYEELMPPNSFIYIGDYKNVQELADYLKLLDSRPELYVQYLEWQYKGSAVASLETYSARLNPHVFCSLIPVIKKVKSGELKRRPVRESNFFNSCRELDKSANNNKSTYGLKNWNPW